LGGLACWGGGISEMDGNFEESGDDGGMGDSWSTWNIEVYAICLRV